MQAMPAAGASVGCNDPAFAGSVEDRDVVARVAGIVEAAIAESLDKGEAFPAGGQVVRLVGRQNEVEDAKMRRDRVSELARRARGENDAAAGLMLLAQPVQDFGAIRKVGRIELDPVGDLAFQS